jgi:hypothetical protein
MMPSTSRARGPPLLVPNPQSPPPARAPAAAQHRGYRASTTALWDTRRKRNPHFQTNVVKKSAGEGGEGEGEGELGWKAWEFGEAPWAKGNEDWDPATGKQGPKKKRKRPLTPEEEEDLKEETRVSDVAAATACLAKFATPARLQRLREIVERRTQHVAFVFENPSNPNNMWACLRSLDAFGVQNVGVVVDPEHYRKPHRAAQAKSAMGASRVMGVWFAGGGGFGMAGLIDRPTYWWLNFLSLT